MAADLLETDWAFKLPSDSVWLTFFDILGNVTPSRREQLNALRLVTSTLPPRACCVSIVGSGVRR